LPETHGSASWSTVISGLNPGTSYLLDFMMANEGGDVGAPQSITVSFASGSSTSAQTFTAPANGVNYWRTWLPEEETFAATAISATVLFSVTNQAEDVGLDNVRVNSVVAAVPEPGTLGLLACGFVGAGLLRKRAANRLHRA
jgi:hypothetical protein